MKKFLAYCILGAVSLAIAAIVIGGLVSAIYAALGGDKQATAFLAMVGILVSIFGLCIAIVWAGNEIQK